MKTRQELQQVIVERYRSATRLEEKQILDEFTQVTGFHRQHAIRSLQSTRRENRYRALDSTTRRHSKP